MHQHVSRIACLVCTRRFFVRLAVLALLGGALLSSGCAGARPWERELLASPRMQLDPDPEATLLEQHVYQYREGSAGGYGGGGGGCGCN